VTYEFIAQNNKKFRMNLFSASQRFSSLEIVYVILTYIHAHTHRHKRLQFNVSIDICIWI